MKFWRYSRNPKPESTPEVFDAQHLGLSDTSAVAIILQKPHGSFGSPHLLMFVRLSCPPIGQAFPPDTGDYSYEALSWANTILLQCGLLRLQGYHPFLPSSPQWAWCVTGQPEAQMHALCQWWWQVVMTVIASLQRRPKPNFSAAHIPNSTSCHWF